MLHKKIVFLNCLSTMKHMQFWFCELCSHLSFWLQSLAYKVIIANFPTWFPNLKKLNVQANMAKDLEAAVIAILLSSSLSLQDIVIQERWTKLDLSGSFL
ncbi:hypothetical protein AMTRI_Chr05g63690 [Amborella trichopoda]